MGDILKQPIAIAAIVVATIVAVAVYSGFAEKIFGGIKGNADKSVQQQDKVLTEYGDPSKYNK